MSEKTLTRKILEYLRDYPGATVKDIAMALGISVNLARTIVYRLKSRGLLEKSGMGYVLTSYAESILGPSKPEEAGRETAGKAMEHPTAAKEAVSEKPAAPAQPGIRETQATIPKPPTKPPAEGPRSVEERIGMLEQRIRELERMLGEVKRELVEVKSIIGRRKAEEIKGRRVVGRPEKPVMTQAEAQYMYGERLRTLIYEGKLVVIGSIVVDGEYYREFVSRFPISVKEAEKLPEHDRAILEAMKSEGLVYIRGGKYMLVE